MPCLLDDVARSLAACRRERLATDPHALAAQHLVDVADQLFGRRRRLQRRGADRSFHLAGLEDEHLAAAQLGHHGSRLSSTCRRS